MDTLDRQAILVVDDAESVRRMICAMLSQAGYECLEAAGGFEALEMLSADPNRIGVLLSDIRMPGMDGTELARHVSNQWPRLPIIFMSGFTDEPLPARNGTSLFLPKPFSASALIAAVRQSLEGDSRRAPNWDS